MTRGVWLGAVLLTCSLSAGAFAGEAPLFAAGPTVSREGSGARIRFAVSRPTDVAVYVLDSSGEVVRHLAAGVLGANAPEPLEKNSLSQTLLWDGKDDLGRPVPAGRGPFRVRICAGMKVRYAGTAFSERTGPNNITEVLGLAVGPDGRLYVLSSRWGSQHWTAITQMHVFRRDGSYERTIKPFPANLCRSSG